MSRSEPPARPDRVTIREVARRAGVSVTTVSHTLNRPNRVRASTRDRVLQTIDELQFVPKAAAVNVARKGVGRIGVLAPFTSYPSYLSRLVGVLRGVGDEPIDVVVYDHGSVAEAADPILSALPVRGRLDGLIIAGVPIDDVMAERIISRGLPTVLVDSDHPRFSTVNVDDEAGGFQLGMHMLERGHRRFAFVAEPQASLEYVSAGQRRMHGVRRALESAGLGKRALRWVVTTPEFEGGQDAAAEILELKDRPTAVVAHHDTIAAGLLRGFALRGVDVPGEIAVAGYDGGPLADALGLTTMVQPLAATGRIAVSMLRERLADPSVPVQHLNLAPELSVGTTT